MKRMIIAVFAVFMFWGVASAENFQPEQNTLLIKCHYNQPNSWIGDKFEPFLEWKNAGSVRFRPAIGYVWSKGYPIGFNLSNLRLGFAKEEVQYPLSLEEYRVPTWNVHAMNMWGVVLAGPFGVSVGLDMGLNMAKRYMVDPEDPSNYFKKTKVYFAVAPLVGVNFFMFNAFAGYEFVPGFKDIQGWIFGGGLSFCFHD